MPIRLVVLVAASTVILSGCFWHLGQKHKHAGKKYTMSSGQIEYLEDAAAKINDVEKRERAEGKPESEVLQAKCAAYDPFIAKAPDEWASNFTSAKKLLKRDKKTTCEAAENAAKDEQTAAAKAENEKRRTEAEAEWAAVEAEAAAEQAEKQAEAEQAEAEYKARLQETVWKVGKIRAQVIDYREIGGGIGADLGGEFIPASTAAGVYVGILVKVENTAKKSKMIDSDDFILVDGDGNRYDVDLDGSIAYAMFLKDESHKAPELLQLHPGMPTYTVLVFDIAETVVTDTKLKLDFRGAKFPLVFEE